MTDPYATPTDDTPFHILVLADLSGRTNRGLTAAGRELGARKPVAVDRDDFDDVLARFAPSLVLAVGDQIGDQVTLRFGELDDFHPDAIVRRCPLFGRLRDLRSRLDDERTFAAAADELRAGLADAPAPATPAADPESAAEPVSAEAAGVSVTDVFGADFMDQVIAGSGGPVEEDMDALVRSLAGPGLSKITVPGRAPDQDELVRFVDDLLAEKLRAILHHPDFQALEATWRSVFEMTRRLRTSGRLRIFLADVAAPEVRADLGEKDVTQSGLHKLLVADTVGMAGGIPWTLVVVDATFDATPADVTTLLRLAKLARAGGASVLAAADGRVVGCEDVARAPESADWTYEGDPAGRKVWTALRQLPEAALLGLVWPRWLVRSPYGAAADPCEDFPFEELPGANDHARFLWGNGAFVAAIALGRAFAEAGWNLLRGGYDPEMDGLPTHTYDDDGDPALLPCAEAWVTLGDAEVAANHGVMPLLSVRHQGAVRLARLNGLATPSAPLVGRWS